jgi:glutathione S-transferase
VQTKGRNVIELYTFGSTNGHKVAIALDGLVDQLLADRSYFLGAEYSIVDIAFYGWYFAAKSAGFDFDQRADLRAWFERVGARPAVARGVTIPARLPRLPARKRV